MRNLKKIYAIMAKWVYAILIGNRRKTYKLLSEDDIYSAIKCNMNSEYTSISGKEDFELPVDSEVLERTNVDSVILSFVISVYNTEKYVEECIMSIINQKTKYKYNIFVIDNASTDGSSQILERLYRNNSNIITLIKLNKNLGPGAGKNAGINLADGKYISFVDSDDIISSDYVEKLISRAISRNADCVKGGYQQFDDANNILYTRRLGEISVECNDKFYSDIVVELDCFVWGGVIKRDLFECVRFPIGYKKIIDDRIMKLFITRFIKRIELMDEVVYFYRKNSSGTTLSKSAFGKFQNQLVFYTDLISKYKELDLPQDVLFRRIVLNEYGNFLFFCIQNEDIDIRIRIFKHICNYICELIDNEDGLNNIERMYYRCFRNADFVQWKLIYKYRHMCNVANEYKLLNLSMTKNDG